MMSFIWPSRKQIDCPTAIWHESNALPGIRFSIRRISLGSRLNLMKAMKELLTKNDFLRAGDVLEQTDAVLSDLMAKSVYLRWGLCGLSGLLIDGRQATTEALIESGPETLSNEIVDAIRESLELSADERKNY